MTTEQQIAELERQIAVLKRKAADEQRETLAGGLYTVTVTFHMPVFATDERTAREIARSNARDEVGNSGTEYVARIMDSAERLAFTGCLPWDRPDHPWPQNLTICDVR